MLKSTIIVLFVVLCNLSLINGDTCACRCCSQTPCTPRVLPEVFEVNRCWYKGGQECLNQCKIKYPADCGRPTAFAVPFCQGSSAISLNLLLIFGSILIHRLFIQ
ncbi:unnamed protein product [Adineta ricciae]|uniref:Uncharacterized protein n=1 Tax=Adineta ricciae TaxID=249248 RepID=A0A815E2X4_ADIRI|nr:unnamed protein product [Adineta ricciae]